MYMYIHLIFNGLLRFLKKSIDCRNARFGYYSQGSVIIKRKQIPNKNVNRINMNARFHIIRHIRILSSIEGVHILPGVF